MCVHIWRVCTGAVLVRDGIAQEVWRQSGDCAAPSTVPDWRRGKKNPLGNQAPWSSAALEGWLSRKFWFDIDNAPHIITVHIYLVYYLGTVLCVMRHYCPYDI